MPALLSLCCYYCSVPRRNGQDSGCVRLWGKYGIGKECLSVTMDDIRDKKKERKKKLTFLLFQICLLMFTFSKPFVTTVSAFLPLKSLSFSLFCIRWCSLNAHRTRKKWQTSSIYAVFSSVLLSPRLCIRQLLCQDLPAQHSWSTS